MSTSNTPVVRISICKQPEQLQPDIYVVGGTVQAALPVEINPVLAPLVRFYPEVPIRVPCTQEGCDGHFKYGVWEDRNLPVVFTNHKYEIAYYHAFVIKATLPFKIADRGNSLMDGIKWYSASPRDGQIGLTNTCMIDGFLMDFKLRALDISYCVGCLFMHKSGYGRMIERALRTIIHYIFVVTKPTPSSDGMYQVVRKMSYEQQLFVKRIWIDKTFTPDELRTEMSTDYQGNQHLINDLMSDPNSRRRMMTRLSMYRMLLENLSPVCNYIIKLACLCGSKNYHCLFYRFKTIDHEDGPYIYPEPAFQTFNPMTLEFETDYRAVGEGETARTRDVDKNTTRRVNGMPCPRCNANMRITHIATPLTSWILICETPVFMRHSISLDELSIAVVFGSHAFELSWVSYMVRGNHFVSAHLLNGTWYYYDDIAGGSGSRECPIIPIDLDNFNPLDYEMQRVFYRRTTETNPHRCIKTASDEEVNRLMNVN